MTAGGRAGWDRNRGTAVLVEPVSGNEWRGPGVTDNEEPTRDPGQPPPASGRDRRWASIRGRALDWRVAALERLRGNRGCHVNAADDDPS